MALIDNNGNAVIEYIYDVRVNHTVLIANGQEIDKSDVAHIGNKNPSDVVLGASIGAGVEPG